MHAVLVQATCSKKSDTLRIRGILFWTTGVHRTNGLYTAETESAAWVVEYCLRSV